jgi:hypothetical protein
MMHLAMFDAANAVACNRSGSYVSADCLGTSYNSSEYIANWANPDVGTAIDYAAHTVLSGVYPSRNFDSDLAAAQAGIPVNASQQQGQSIGVKVGNEMVSYRANDGSTDQTPYTHSTSPGQWRPTGSGDAATPNWGKVQMFSRASSSNFRPQLPGGFSTMTALLKSTTYTAQFNLDRTYKPPGQLFAHTRIVSDNRGLDQLANAKLFALVAAAMADAGVAAWDSKYETDIDLWRPETAIRLAADDSNPKTAPDPSWQPLSANRDGVHFSPAFPAYVSGHATFGGAWAAAMAGYFGTDSITFTATTEDPHALEVKRTFTSFSAAAIENARSRIYLGVHYQFDGDFGRSTGTSVGNYVVSRLLRPHPQPFHLSSWPTYQDCDDEGAALVYGYRIYNSYDCRYNGGTGQWDLWVTPWS